MDELGFPSLTGYVQDVKALTVAAGAKPVNTFTEADWNLTGFLAVDSVGTRDVEDDGDMDGFCDEYSTWDGDIDGDADRRASVSTGNDEIVFDGSDIENNFTLVL